jgi:hypothetical protein
MAMAMAEGVVSSMDQLPVDLFVQVLMCLIPES